MKWRNKRISNIHISNLSFPLFLPWRNSDGHQMPASGKTICSRIILALISCFHRKQFLTRREDPHMLSLTLLTHPSIQLAGVCSQSLGPAFGDFCTPNQGLLSPLLVFIFYKQTPSHVSSTERKQTGSLSAGPLQLGVSIPPWIGGSLFHRVAPQM